MPGHYLEPRAPTVIIRLVGVAVCTPKQWRWGTGYVEAQRGTERYRLRQFASTKLASNKTVRLHIALREETDIIPRGPGGEAASIRRLVRSGSWATSDVVDLDFKSPHKLRLCKTC